jgi:Mg2+/Co2+ transporter CorB
MTERMLGDSKYALALGTVAVTFLILVFLGDHAEGNRATHADRMRRFGLPPVAAAQSREAGRLVRQPVRAGAAEGFRIRQADDSSARLTQEELRSLVLEGQYFRGKHRALLANLLDLEAVTVDDVMTPRNRSMRSISARSPRVITEQLATSYHTRLPAYEGALDDIVGVIHLRQVVHLQRDGEVDADELRTILRRRTSSRRHAAAGAIAAVPDRSRAPGPRRRRVRRIEGLVTIEDIIEEIIGDFTTQAPDGADSWQRAEDGTLVIDGLAPLRTLNRKLGTRFPVDGPEDAQRPHPGASRRYPRSRHARARGGRDARSAADAGPWRQSRTPARSGRPRGRLAFTKRGSAGIIDRVSFMRLE